MSGEQRARWTEQELEYGDTPNHRALGLTLVVENLGEVLVRYDGTREGGNKSGRPAGGMLAQMVDSAVMQAVLTHLGEGDSATTLELKVNFLKGAEPGAHVVATGRLEHLGRSTAVGIGRISDESGRTIAFGTATISIRRQG